MESDDETDDSEDEMESGEGEFVSDLEESDIDDLEEAYEMDGQEARSLLPFFLCEVLTVPLGAVQLWRRQLGRLGC